MELYDVRNRIEELLDQGGFELEGAGVSLVEPTVDLEMTYLGGRYWITICDMDAPQKRQSVVAPDPEDRLT